ncbi:MAG: hypothetical protein H3C47_14220 [Candidatus Cloacimonetes bacterium]|nr:hypothetical protein [Candidatus Cloacimonadota bacterium]
MEQVIFTVVIFSTCFFLCALGLLLSGKPLKKSCGKIPGDLNDDISDCLCESTGRQDACSGLQEEDIVAALQRVKESR